MRRWDRKGIPIKAKLMESDLSEKAEKAERGISLP
jgi:hypothetical protein